MTKEGKLSFYSQISTSNVATLNVYTYICGMKIDDEIQQKQFRNPHQKAAINLIFSAAWLNHRHAQALKPLGISIQQFNILRILRGMHPQPATVKLLTERMLDKMSNASRLVDKLKMKGLVDREACQEELSRVNIRITRAGFDLLKLASSKIEQEEEALSDYLSIKEAETLSHLLDKLRG